MTMKYTSYASSYPESWTATRFGWLISETSFASRTNRFTYSGFCLATSRSRILTANGSACSPRQASQTDPMPPFPSSRLIV